MNGNIQHVTRKTADSKPTPKGKPRVAIRTATDSSPPPLLRQTAGPDATGRNVDVGLGKMNSMIPKPSPRSDDKSADSPLKNSGRGNSNKALDSIGSHGVKRLETALSAGKSDIHKASTKQLHKDRAFIYDQTKAGMFGNAKNKMVDKALGLGGKMGIDSATEKQEKRTQMILDAKQLKPYQKRIKKQNPEAAKREKIASTLKKTKKGAKYADYVGTGVSFVAPQVGAGIKIGAKATKLAAGVGATIGYETARKGYLKNVDDKASGDAMFDSHVAKEKADMMKNTRNKMAVSTGASLVASVGSFALEGAVEDLSQKAASGIQGGYDIGKRVAKDQIKKPFKEKIRENKSELVNLMQLQKSRADYQKRKTSMDAAIANRQMANMANKK